MISPYQFAVNNCAKQMIKDSEIRHKLMHLKSNAHKMQNKLESELAGFDAFHYSAVLGIAFMKDKAEVVIDISNAVSKLEMEE